VVTACAISPNSDFVVTGSKDQTGKIWDAGPQVRNALPSGATAACQRPAQSAPIGLHRHGEFGQGRGRYLQDLGRGDRQGARYPGRPHPRGQRLRNQPRFGLHSSRRVRTGRARSGTRRRARKRTTLAGHTGYVNACAISPGFGLRGHGEWTTRLQDLGRVTGQERATLVGHTGRVTACRNKPRFETSWSRRVTTRLAGSGTRRRAGARHPGRPRDWVDAVAISSDSNLVVTASSDQTCKIWDAATGRERATLAGCTETVNASTTQPRAGLHRSRTMTALHGLGNGSRHGARYSHAPHEEDQRLRIQPQFGFRRHGE